MADFQPTDTGYTFTVGFYDRAIYPDANWYRDLVRDDILRPIDPCARTFIPFIFTDHTSGNGVDVKLGIFAWDTITVDNASKTITFSIIEIDEIEAPFVLPPDLFITGGVA